MKRLAAWFGALCGWLLAGELARAVKLSGVLRPGVCERNHDAHPSLQGGRDLALLWLRRAKREGIFSNGTYCEGPRQVLTLTTADAVLAGKKAINCNLRSRIEGIAQKFGWCGHMSDVRRARAAVNMFRRAA